MMTVKRAIKEIMKFSHKPCHTRREKKRIQDAVEVLVATIAVSDYFSDVTRK